MKKLISALCLFLASFSLLAHQPGETFNARAAWVHDGDTLTVTTGHIMERNLKRWRIRLSDIDAPEKDQDFGREAIQALRDLVLTREVIVYVLEKDPYDRLVARLYVQRHGEVIDVNHELLRLGLAWVYPQYLHDHSLHGVEEEAKAAKRGLWAKSDPVPPWDWRRDR